MEQVSETSEEILKKKKNKSYKIKLISHVSCSSR